MGTLDRLAGLWFGRSERYQMAILWMLAVLTTPSMYASPSPWAVIWMLPVRIALFVPWALSVLLGLVTNTGSAVGALSDATFGMAALWLNVALVDPALGFYYTIGPVVAAALWVKVGRWAWGAILHRDEPAPVGAEPAE